MVADKYPNGLNRLIGLNRLNGLSGYEYMPLPP